MATVIHLTPAEARDLRRALLCGSKMALDHAREHERRARLASMCTERVLTRWHEGHAEIAKSLALDLREGADTLRDARRADVRPARLRSA